jgi:nicotinate-nucleotide pyrophosphorylase (carboxylating)
MKSWRQSESKVKDIRDSLFGDVPNKKVSARIWANESGVVVGIGRMTQAAAKIGVSIDVKLRDGDEISCKGTIAIVEGTPKQISVAEDELIGTIAKTSGVATAARNAVRLAGERVRIVSGGWKKMPIQIKEEIREALRLGGVGIRISEEPFVYLDKNYIRIFGGISQALRAASRFADRIKVVQIRGETGVISDESIEAVNHGAAIIMVDTGEIKDLVAVIESLKKARMRDRVKVAFGGAIKLEEIPKLAETGVDILDIGRALIDAPMLDIKFDVSVASNEG